MTTGKIVPDGCHTVNPHIVVRGVREAMAFYQKALGAEPGEIHYMPDGKTIIHAQIQIGDSRVMMAEESPQWGNLSPLALGNSPVTLHTYVKDVDAVFNAAVAAGAKPAMPPADMFWGDRYAKIVDPFGHHWSLATHLKDLTPAEVDAAGKEFFAKMGPPPKCEG